ncbi:MAG: hypothetical protein Q9209_003655 [Squamulea sp. 1 TL-2023]
MPPITTLQHLMLPHQCADTLTEWARFRHTHHENFIHAGRLRNLVVEQISKARALAMTATDDREIRVGLKKCAREFKGLVGKKTEWW